MFGILTHHVSSFRSQVSAVTVVAAWLLGVLPLHGADAAKPCVFCEIIAGQRQPEGIVYRDDEVTAFLSLGARNPGHVLIVPNRHAENFMAVPDDTMHHMTDVAQKLIAAIMRTDLRAEGIMLQMNSGKAAGQSVFHAHLHIIPRFAGDAPTPPAEGATGQADAPPPPKRAGEPFPMTELAPVAAKIRAALEQKPFELPAINTEVSLSQIKAICEHYGLHNLWRKIERDPPVRPFKSDGCTGWFDDWRGVSLYPAGFLHDLKYWAGYPGEGVARLNADAELMTDVALLLGSTEMAETMFRGVRVGGSEKLRTSFAWGFGRN
jgi:diadenosine tetraphosphate (Ap4A) HIT family hydrolase